MSTGRAEAFSDGVLAVIITIMVLELHAPDGTSFDALRHVLGAFGAYVLSFVMIGIYWNNHHHLFQATERVTGTVLWANLHLLFWLSLMPFTTAWMSEHHFDAVPVAVWGVPALAAAIAYYLLQRTIIREQGLDSRLAAALDSDLKGKASPVLYAAAIPLAALSRWVSLALYVAVALMWLIPDRRLEHGVQRAGEPA